MWIYLRPGRYPSERFSSHLDRKLQEQGKVFVSRSIRNLLYYRTHQNGPKILLNNYHRFAAGDSHDLMVNIKVGDYMCSSMTAKPGSYSDLTNIFKDKLS